MTEGKTETNSGFEAIDKRIREHAADLAMEPMFHWHEHEQFEFYLLITGFDISRSTGANLVTGHARSANGSGPFPEAEWAEVQLPVPTRLQCYLEGFAKLKELETFRQFENQLFFIAFGGIDWHNDPHKGKVRLYQFYSELIEEDGSRVQLDA